MATNHKDEKNLLLRLRSGDHTAFEKLYHLYSCQLLAKLDKKVNYSSDSEDILQDLFIKIWERRRQIDPDKPFAGYLYRIGERMVVDHYRKIARTNSMYSEVQHDQTEVISPTEDMIAASETQRLLQQAVAQLPPQQQRAFSLCKLEGKSHKEAAEIMEINQETVHAHLTKAVKSVRSYFRGNSHQLPGLLALTLILL
ncbi:MAG: sigma-70 family RNA polymerase sigma factor [Crocinitomicaceae bacterium]|nr:sigma-70 family RNA polymerase sigma factor [Crocinitomicaceae bacterium]